MPTKIQDLDTTEDNLTAMLLNWTGSNGWSYEKTVMSTERARLNTWLPDDVIGLIRSLLQMSDDFIDSGQTNDAKNLCMSAMKTAKAYEHYLTYID